MCFPWREGLIVDLGFVFGATLCFYFLLTKRRVIVENSKELGIRKIWLRMLAGNQNLMGLVAALLAYVTSHELLYLFEP